MDIDTATSNIRSQNQSFPVCPLLSLPGELRNRIYDYCIEPGWFSLLLSLPSTARWYRHNKLSHTHFGCLRYVCSVIRHEYTPLYLARTVVPLRPLNVEQYLAVFYPRLPIRGTNPSENLSLNSYGYIRFRLRLGETLDLTPFVGLLCRAPKVRIELARGLNPILRDASELLTTIVESSCSMDLENTVEQISFRYSRRAEVVVKLYRGIRPKELSQGTPRQWLVDQVIPTLPHLIIVVESTEGLLWHSSPTIAWP